MFKKHYVFHRSVRTGRPELTSDWMLHSSYVHREAAEIKWKDLKTEWGARLEVTIIEATTIREAKGLLPA